VYRWRWSQELLVQASPGRARARKVEQWDDSRDAIKQSVAQAAGSSRALDDQGISIL
jgi:predicted Co/Zn/Cd cation transporter (cation efflux family)